MVSTVITIVGLGVLANHGSRIKIPIRTCQLLTIKWSITSMRMRSTRGAPKTCIRMVKPIKIIITIAAQALRTPAMADSAPIATTHRNGNISGIGAQIKLFAFSLGILFICKLGHRCEVLQREVMHVEPTEIRSGQNYRNTIHRNLRSIFTITNWSATIFSWPWAQLSWNMHTIGVSTYWLRYASSKNTKWRTGKNIHGIIFTFDSWKSSLLWSMCVRSNHQIGSEALTQLCKNQNHSECWFGGSIAWPRFHWDAQRFWAADSNLPRT